MPKLTRQLPKYRLHRATRQAVVVLEGRTFYLAQVEQLRGKSGLGDIARAVLVEKS